MNWREMSEGDLDQCLKIASRHLGDEIVGRATALQVWRSLVRNRMFRSAVLEFTSPEGVTNTAGFGSSLFVRRDFTDRELVEPKPFLNSRVIASIAQSQAVVLSEDSFRSSNDGKGLDIVVLGGVWVPEGLSEEKVHQAQTLLAVGFAELHVGYRLNRIFSEAIGEVQRDFLISSGVWREVERFEVTDRSLVLLSRESAFAASGSVAAVLFQYEAPILGLRDSDKQLLAEALVGGTDAEVACRLHLALASVKKRWQALFDRIAQVQPKLLHEPESRFLEGSRGVQKRHHVLAYVRSHPQELRPYHCPR